MQARAVLVGRLENPVDVERVADLAVGAQGSSSRRSSSAIRFSMFLTSSALAPRWFASISWSGCGACGASGRSSNERTFTTKRSGPVVSIALRRRFSPR